MDAEETNPLNHKRRAGRDRDGRQEQRNETVPAVKHGGFEDRIRLVDPPRYAPWFIHR